MKSMSTLAQEHVIRRVGRAAIGAGGVAGPLQLSALGMDPLHGGGSGEYAAAAMGNHLELQPGNIVRRRAGSAAGDLSDHGAAVAMLPVRSGIVAGDGLAIGQKRRDRLTERPGRLAVGARLALVHLGAFGVHAE